MNSRNSFLLELRVTAFSTTHGIVATVAYIEEAGLETTTHTNLPHLVGVLPHLGHVYEVGKESGNAIQTKLMLISSCIYLVMPVMSTDSFL